MAKKTLHIIHSIVQSFLSSWWIFSCSKSYYGIHSFIAMFT